MLNSGKVLIPEASYKQASYLTDGESLCFSKKSDKRNQKRQTSSSLSKQAFPPKISLSWRLQHTNKEENLVSNFHSLGSGNAGAAKHT